MSRPNPPIRAEEGLHNEAHAKALTAALAGKSDALEGLLSRAAGWPGGKLNLKLAAAFGVAIGRAPGDPLRLLTAFSDDDAPSNTPRVILPVCAAYGWVALLRAEREVESAWQALCVLGADGRHPVQRAVFEALTTYCDAVGTDVMMTRATSWLDIDDRELRYGASAMVLEILAQDPVVARVKDRDGVRDYVTRVIDDVAGAPRAAERSEMRRRALKALPAALSCVGGRMREDEATAWLTEQVEQAKHPGVREALSNAIAGLRKRGHKGLADLLAEGLKSSATPPRDPTRVRQGTERGKRSRRMR